MANLTFLRTSGTNNAVPVARNPRVTHGRYKVVALRTLKSMGIDCRDTRVDELLEAVAYESYDEMVVDADADWTVCRCRLHQSMECGVEGAEGCRAEACGQHPAIASLYAADHRVCLVEPGVRELDRQVFQLAEYGEATGRPGRNRGRMPDPRGRYMRGYGTQPKRMGAWYCYTSFYPESFVVRSGRVLGPRPKKLRIIRYALIFGRPVVEGFELSELSNGDLHVSTGGSRDVPLIEALYQLLKTGDIEARVGTDDSEEPVVVDAFDTASVRNTLVRVVRAGPTTGERVDGEYSVSWDDGLEVPCLGIPTLPETEIDRWARLKDWLESMGVRLNKRAFVPLMLATRAMAFMPEGLPGAKERHRVWQLHGDAVLRQCITRRACETDANVVDVILAYKSVENKALCKAFSESPLRDCCRATGLVADSKAVADIVEAFVGVVDLYCGAVSSEALLQRFVLEGALQQRVVRESVAFGGEVIGLNSQQLKVAVRLASRGLLDIDID